jgi:hypothetical protein
MQIELHDATLAAEMQVVDDPFTREKHLRRAILFTKLLRCAIRGMSAKEAAKYVGCWRGVAQEIYRDPSFRAQVRERVESSMASGDAEFMQREQTLQDKIAAASNKAFDVLQEMLEDTQQDPRLRVRVAEGFLDRNPEAARKTESKSTHTHNFSVEQLMNAARTADELYAHNVLPIPKKEIA